MLDSDVCTVHNEHNGSRLLSLLHILLSATRLMHGINVTCLSHVCHPKYDLCESVTSVSFRDWLTFYSESMQTGECMQVCG